MQESAGDKDWFIGDTPSKADAAVFGAHWLWHSGGKHRKPQREFAMLGKHPWQACWGTRTGSSAMDPARRTQPSLVRIGSILCRSDVLRKGLQCLSQQDIDALAGLLGDKDWFIGDMLSKADAAVFGAQSPFLL